MSNTTRKHKYRPYSKENKEARKFTSRRLRRESRAAAKEAKDYRGEVEVVFPKHQKTSGWITW